MPDRSVHPRTVGTAAIALAAACAASARSMSPAFASASGTRMKCHRSSRCSFTGASSATRSAPTKSHTGMSVVPLPATDS
jgi:hypothetical protein